MIEYVISPEDEDPILCEWCHFPIGSHPQDERGTYRCKVFKVKTDVQVIA